MVEISLSFAVVGEPQAGSGVKIDDGAKVWELKEAIADKLPKRIKCAAVDLQLFLAKTSKKEPKEEEEAKSDGREEWLTQLDARQGVSGTSGYKLLLNTDEVLRDVGLRSGGLGEVGPAERAAGKGPVHILVEVPGSCAWKLADAKCPLLAFDPKSPIIRIPKAYAEGSGLYVGEDGVVLYLRKDVQEEWTALWKSVVQSYATLWIVGPPGTGKSCAAFAFACSLRRVGGGEQWKVVWIHCSKRSRLLSCILFSGDDEKRTCTFKRSLLEDVLKSLNDYTVVFIDGYVKDRDERKVMWPCRQWRKKEKERRRIVVVSSMVSMGKDWRPDLYRDIPSIAPSSLESSVVIASAPESNTMQEEQLFTMFSWTLEDYQEALKNDELFEHVKNNLTARSSVTMESRMESLEEKFFVAGGSARMMFDESTESAMDSLLSALARVEDLTQCLTSTFGRPGSVVNRLFSLHPGACLYLSKPGILSSFVAREIGIRTGPAKLQALAQWLATNPAMDGCMFEMFFFSSLTNGSAVILSEGRCNEGEVWTSNFVARFDPDREIRLYLPHQWFAPTKWNQGGNDAVFYELKGLDNTECDRSARGAGFTMKIFVRIVQVTRSETPSFKVEYYKDLLTRFTVRQSMWLHAVEVCFVAPSDVVSEFTLPVDEATFRREGVEPVFHSKIVATDICIRVVALENEMWRPKVGLKRFKRN